MFDTHIHTDYSTDSAMEIEAAIKRADEMGLGIITTDHMDYNYPFEGKFVFDPVKYINHYSKYRGDNVLIGIEIGLDVDYVDKNKKVVTEHEFDYVLGSLHMITGEDIYDSSIYKKKTKKEVYSLYFNDMAKCIKTHDFIDSLGHIDFISRYAAYEDPEISYNDFKDEIDEVLRLIAEKEIAIELNTRRFVDKKAVENLTTILKRYKELGGCYITIGSDAHRIENIGSGIESGANLIKDLGLKPVYFKERKMAYL